MLSATLFVFAMILLGGGLVLLLVPIRGAYQWSLALIAILGGWALACFGVPITMAADATNLPEWMIKVRPYLSHLFPAMYLIGIGFLLHLGRGIARGTDYYVDMWGRGFQAAPPQAPQQPQGPVGVEQAGLASFLFVAAIACYAIGGIMLVVGLYKIANPTSEIDAALATMAKNAQKADGFGKQRYFAKSGSLFEIHIPGDEMYKNRKEEWAGDVKHRQNDLGIEEDVEGIVKVYHSIPRGTLVMRAVVTYTKTKTDKMYQIYLEKDYSEDEEKLQKWIAEQERVFAAFVPSKSGKTSSSSPVMTSPGSGSFSSPAGLSEEVVVGTKPAKKIDPPAKKKT